MKVYCKNCKYFIPRTRNSQGMKDKEYPECKAEAKKVSRFDKIVVEYGRSPYTKNEKNDCKDYKRKWWKFWVKG